MQGVHTLRNVHINKQNINIINVTFRNEKYNNNDNDDVKNTKILIQTIAMRSAVFAKHSIYHEKE